MADSNKNSSLEGFSNRSLARHKRSLRLNISLLSANERLRLQFDDFRCGICKFRTSTVTAFVVHALTHVDSLETPESNLISYLESSNAPQAGATNLKADEPELLAILNEEELSSEADSDSEVDKDEDRSEDENFDRGRIRQPRSRESRVRFEENPAGDANNDKSSDDESQQELTAKAKPKLKRKAPSLDSEEEEFQPAPKRRSKPNKKFSEDFEEGFEETHTSKRRSKPNRKFVESSDQDYEEPESSKRKSKLNRRASQDETDQYIIKTNTDSDNEPLVRKRKLGDDAEHSVSKKRAFNSSNNNNNNNNDFKFKSVERQSLVKKRGRPKKQQIVKEVFSPSRLPTQAELDEMRHKTLTVKLLRWCDLNDAKLSFKPLSKLIKNPKFQEKASTSVENPNKLNSSRVLAIVLEKSDMADQLLQIPRSRNLSESFEEDSDHTSEEDQMFAKEDTTSPVHNNTKESTKGDDSIEEVCIVSDADENPTNIDMADVTLEDEQKPEASTVYRPSLTSIHRRTQKAKRQCRIVSTGVSDLDDKQDDPQTGTDDEDVEILAEISPNDLHKKAVKPKKAGPLSKISMNPDISDSEESKTEILNSVQISKSLRVRLIGEKCSDCDFKGSKCCGFLVQHRKGLFLDWPHLNCNRNSRDLGNEEAVTSSSDFVEVDSD